MDDKTNLFSDSGPDLHNIIMSISNAVLREGAPSTLAFSRFTCIQRFLWIFSEPFSDIMHHPYF